MDQQLFIEIYRISVIIVFIISLRIRYTGTKSCNVTDLLAILFILAECYFIGSREINIGTDTLSYKYIYDDFNAMGFNPHANEMIVLFSQPVFYLIFMTGSALGSFQVALILISFTTLLFSYLFCISVSKEFSPKLNPLSLLCCYLISFYILNQQINIIKAGLSAAFLLNYYMALYRKSRYGSLIYAALALGCHFTSLIPITLALIPRFLKMPDKYYLAIFTLCLILSVFNVGILNLGIGDIGLGEKKSYLTSESNVYITGFRWGFALYNSFFLLLYYSRIQAMGDLGKFLFRLYAVMSCIFFACFQIPYSDRIGAFSWNIIPFLTVITFRTKFRNAQRVVADSFIFLLFVALII